VTVREKCTIIKTEFVSKFQKTAGPRKREFVKLRNSRLSESAGKINRPENGRKFSYGKALEGAEELKNSRLPGSASKIDGRRIRPEI